MNATVCKRLEIVLIDDNSVAENVEEITRRLTKGKITGSPVRFLLGPYSSELTEPLAKVADENGALLMAPDAAATAVFRHRPLAFGMQSPARTLLYTAIGLLFNNSIRSIALLADTAVASKQMCEGAAARAHELGMVVTDSQTVLATTTSQVLRALVQIQASFPDAVIGW